MSELKIPVADVMGITRGTVAATLNAARAALDHQIKEHA